MINTLYLAVETDTIIRILVLGFLGFFSSMLITPMYTTFAYRGEWTSGGRTGLDYFLARKVRDVMEPAWGR